MPLFDKVIPNGSPTAAVATLAYHLSEQHTFTREGNTAVLVCVEQDAQQAALRAGEHRMFIKRDGTQGYYLRKLCVPKKEAKRVLKKRVASQESDAAGPKLSEQQRPSTAWPCQHAAIIAVNPW